MKPLYALAEQLAAPVAMGHLPLTHAHAALINATLRAERAGDLGQYQATDVVSGLRHVLAQHLERHEWARAIGRHRIRLALQPILHAPNRPPYDALLAEAHRINAAQSPPLGDNEVSDLVETEVYFVLPRGPRRGRR